ncbi:MAG: Fic family protein [Rhodobacteraceae bacterium]|nr:Fic family protein [Paracoccaceae bacterium]
MISKNNLNLADSVNYHYGQFPPKSLDYQRILLPLATAVDALARYDQMLLALHNSEILLAPLRSQEAVVSSRMEGTISTLDEVLQFEADETSNPGALKSGYRSETIEVFSYQHAMRRAYSALAEGQPFSEHLIRSSHGTLMRFGRGAEKNPGQFKTEQNFIGQSGSNKISFVPISPLQLAPGMQDLISYMSNEDILPLIRVAISHLEFEALHPFDDGNGRLGRMIITLLLWDLKVISASHFYISGVLEENRDEYIDRMRAVSENNDWTSWVVFFLDVLAKQAKRNLETAEKITSLYDEMKPIFRKKLNSQWAVHAQDFLFENPTFRNNRFTSRSGIPKPTAIRISRILHEQGLLRLVVPASGPSPAMFSFEPLIEIVRNAG